MANHRILTDIELKYIRKQLKSSKNILFWLFLIFAVFIGGIAVVFYLNEKPNVFINILFGFLIFLLGSLHWYFKGYQNHQIDPIVYKGKGYYERIFENHGKNGRYYDTINGRKVKLPWHWRKYLKQQKNQITYEYIIRDGVVAMNEMPIFVVSVDNLSLDYELNNGLNRVKSVSFFNIISLVLLIPAIIILCFEDNFQQALRFNVLFKSSEEDTIIVENPEDLTTMKSNNYIKISNAWVYQFKPSFSSSNENYVISKAERDRIYNHPSSDLNYRFFTPSRSWIKPNKEKILNNLKNSPLSIKTIFKSADTAIVNSAVEKVYQSELRDYNKRVEHSKRAEKIFEVLKPKSFLFKVYDNLLKLSEKKSSSVNKNYDDIVEETESHAEKPSSIRESLESMYSIKGYYLADENRIVSFTTANFIIDDIKDAVYAVGFALIVFLLGLLSIFKIVKNSILKKRLVDAQIYNNNLKRLN